MRKLVWFAVGFTAASACSAYLLPGIVGLLLTFVLLGVGVGFCLWRSPILRIPAAVILGCAIGFGWFFGYDMLWISTARQYDGEIRATTVEITDFSYTTAYGIAADGKINLDEKTFRIRLYIDETLSLNPGDRVTGDIRLRLTTYGGREEATYHQGSGIFLVGYVAEGVSVDPALSVSDGYWIRYLRRGILDTLQAIFPDDTAAFAQALLLGDTTKLTYAQDTAFQLSGIRHVIAVSGLHVSILFALVYMIAGKKRVPTALLGIPTLLLFAAIAGFTPSIVRACVMQILVILALLLNKEYDPPTALAAAVVILLAVNPLAVTSVSFQLSVGCMIGIFLFSKRIHDYILGGKLEKPAKRKNLLGRLLRWTAATVSVTLSAMSLTTPLCAYYFGMVSLIGILTNLLALWVVSFVFYGIMLACALGSVWLGAGQLVAALISWPIRYVQLISGLFSKFPFAAVYTCSDYIVGWLVFCYVLLGLFFVMKNRKPLVLALCMICGLVSAIAASWLEPVTGNYLATVIDVGQGQCVLLQGNGKHYLVDCGGDSPYRAADAAAQLLLSRGIFRLDGVIVTHYDADHVGGVEHLLSRIPTDALYLPDVPDDRGFRDGLVSSHGSSIRWVRKTWDVEGRDYRLTLYPGPAGGINNESSICVLFQRENCDILITGDRSQKGEQYLLEQAKLPQLELLVVGHHGSDSSTGFPLLAATNPTAAAISVGENNHFSHPSEDVLQILQMFECSVYRTDLLGTIDFRG